MKLKLRMFLQFLGAVLASVPKDKAKAIADDLLDVVEKHFADNARVMRFCNVFRSVSDIPDDIGGDED